MGTLILLLAMAGFMVGVIVGELRDQAEQARDERDLAELDEWLSELRVAFGDDEPGRAAA